MILKSGDAVPDFTFTINNGEALASLLLSDVLRSCKPNFECMRAISWQVEGPVRGSWRRWLEDVFEPVLLPHLWRVVDLSARQSAREIIGLDAELNGSMKSGPRQRSIDAGRLLLQQSTPRGERLMARLQEAIQAGAAYGHFATLYGVRCAAFSIPIRAAILGYLLQELVIGAPNETGQVKLLEAAAESVNEFLRISSNGLNEGLRFHG
jgi:hypothetical protein